MRKTKLEIAQALIEFLENRKIQKNAFFKSELLKAMELKGMSSKTAGDWLELCIIFQKAPKVRKIPTGKGQFIYEVINTQ